MGIPLYGRVSDLSSLRRTFAFGVKMLAVGLPMGISTAVRVPSKRSVAKRLLYADGRIDELLLARRRYDPRRS